VIDDFLCSSTETTSSISEDHQIKNAFTDIVVIKIAAANIAARIIACVITVSFFSGSNKIVSSGLF